MSITSATTQQSVCDSNSHSLHHTNGGGVKKRLPKIRIPIPPSIQALLGRHNPSYTHTDDNGVSEILPSRTLVHTMVKMETGCSQDTASIVFHVIMQLVVLITRIADEDVSPDEDILRHFLVQRDMWTTVKSSLGLDEMRHALPIVELLLLQCAVLMDMLYFVRTWYPNEMKRYNNVNVPSVFTDDYIKTKRQWRAYVSTLYESPVCNIQRTLAFRYCPDVRHGPFAAEKMSNFLGREIIAARSFRDEARAGSFAMP